jgi:hypothetical protein
MPKEARSIHDQLHDHDQKPPVDPAAVPQQGLASAVASSASANGATGTDVMVIDYGDDAGAGTENVTKDEYALPFWRILQSNSPQLKPVANGGVPGAKVGQILNTATNELYDGEAGFDFIPVYRDHNFPEFTPRDAGGGFVGIRAVDDPIVLRLRAEQGQFGKLKLRADGGETELTETYYLYGMAVQGHFVLGRGLLGFASTQIRKYKTFVTQAMGIVYPNAAGVPVRPPLWAHRWHLSTIFESNKKGDYYGWRLTLADGVSVMDSIKVRLKLSDPLYLQGREFYELIKQGTVKVDYERAGVDPASQESDDIPM